MEIEVRSMVGHRTSDHAPEVSLLATVDGTLHIATQPLTREGLAKALEDLAALVSGRGEGGRARAEGVDGEPA